MKVKNCYVLPLTLWIVSLMRPCIYSVGLWMPFQIEDLYNPVPYRLAMKFLCYGHALYVCGLAAM